MIRIFDIKKRKNLNIGDNKDFIKNYNTIAKLTNDEILEKYKTNFDGLNNNEATSRLKEDGLNIVIKDNKKSWIYFLLISFKDQFILILLLLATINFFLEDKIGSLIIVLIAIISAFIRFIQDYSTYLFNRKLKTKINSKTIVVRDKKEQSIKVENVAVGDIISLNAGAIIPADIKVISNKDLFINQSVFTGESIAVEKKESSLEKSNLFEIDNICYMGSSVISGSGLAVVINTGFDTYLGTMGKEINNIKETTNFEIGMKKITDLLIEYMVIVCLFVLVVDGIIKANLKEAILFALSVAVGITPSMLPMIVNVNLSKGTKTLAKKKTLVKKIESIQNLGAIDVLCTDKTGTLTEDKIILQKYIDVDGEENINILKYAYINSYFGTGLKNLVDRAIITYAKEHNKESIANDYEKIDEIPFDYERRKMSVIVKNKNSNYIMITKGALENIINNCSKVKKDDNVLEINKDIIYIITKKAEELAANGMQVIALAENIYTTKEPFNKDYENNMTFVGLVGFLDPPKKDIKKTLEKLKNIGITTKILTGDNPYTTSNICSLVGIDNKKIMLGSEIDKIYDDKLKEIIEKIDVFARLNPLQKERIVKLYKENGHVVGYIGDGVNDAPSLHQADIGISVNTATDIAKEASDIILLEKSLNVIYDGVIEGRKVYGNIIKYMKMALSADFGDVFSIMIASIFLPFLPLLPIQMLFQDFIYDISQLAIPYDNVDEEFLKEPKKWNTKGISKFMKVMGITSSIFDVLAFAIFWFILGYNSIDKQAYFQTSWFVMCLISELMIILNVRTSKRPFIDSKASKSLMILTLISIILTIFTPILLSNITTFNFKILPLNYYLYVVLLIILYFIVVTFIKKIYIKKNKEWL